MIPLRLSVKNFMCYRDQVPDLDLEGVHVACLCGDNGHGKTALLDAMTWALWGRARAGTNQEELVHQGQLDMAVELDFLARGQRYRVSRRHSRSARSRTGTTVLELQVASEDGYTPITGNVSRETEARINDIVHMDYDTFINTAFILQGRADMFTRSTPAKRKEVLAEVLDLSYYQALEERARARSRQIEGDAREAHQAVLLRQAESARRPDYEARLAQVNEELGALVPGASSRRAAVEQLRASVGSLRAVESELDQVTRRLATARGEVTDLERQVRAQEEQLTQLNALLEKTDEIRKSSAALAESRAALERLDEALAQKAELDGKRAQASQALAVQGERLAAQANEMRRRIDHELEPRVNRLPEIEAAMTALETEQAALPDMDAAVSALRAQTEEMAGRAQYLDAANAALERDMAETRQKFDLLEQGESLCPLCRQPLGADGQEHLRREYQARGLESKRAYQANSDEKAKTELRRKEVAATIAAEEARLRRERRRLEEMGANLRRDREESLAAQQELSRLAAELGRLNATIEAQDFGGEHRQAIGRLDEQLAALEYDSQAHATTRERVRRLEPYADLNRRLLDAEATLPMARQTLASTVAMLESRRTDVEDSQARRATLAAEVKALPSMEAQLKDAEAGLREAQSALEKAQVEKGVLEDHLQRIDALEDEIRTYEAERAGLAEQKSIYDELATAFGKNGIQALIIETSIPQLEADANELLGRLTENRMSLRLQLEEGRRDRRTGQPAEELGIRIADEVGTRSYETFSGGEAFRINFALRIGLSRLLARRSGAPLPTLFIDEGFGSQDSAGQERLTEAIQSIQDDFEKIIVITHIDRVKEAFPVRIEVAKTEQGSTFQLV